MNRVSPPGRHSALWIYYMTTAALILVTGGTSGRLDAQTETTFAAYVTYAAPPYLNFDPIADTYLKQGNPNQNQGDEGILRVQKSQINRALVKFDMNQVAAKVAGRPLISATLRLYVTSAGSWGTNGAQVCLPLINSVQDSAWQRYE